MSRGQEWRSKGSALVALLAFVFALLLSWAHPVEQVHAADHLCAGDTHLAQDQAGHHDEAGCALCDLGHSAALTPPLPPSLLVASSPRGQLACAETGAEPGAPLLGFDPRGPPV